LNKVRRSEAPGVHGHIDVGVVRHHHHWQIRLHLPDRFQQHQAILVGGAFVPESDVEQDHTQASIE